MISTPPLAPSTLEPALARLPQLTANLRAAREDGASHYGALNPIWAEVVDALSYVFDLPAEHVLRARMHSGLFVGEAPWTYWHTADSHDGPALATQLGYRSLIKDIPRQLWLSEPHNPLIPRPMGVTFEDHVINANVVRNQSVITNLKLTGIWDRLMAPGPDAACVVEIGAGYGGLAEPFFAQSERPVHFVAVDLPEILMFACGYLLAAIPGLDVRVARSEADLAAVPQDRHVLSLVSAFEAEHLCALKSIDLALNTVSFQEMNGTDIDAYLALIMPRLTGVLYSDNIDRHQLNTGINEPISTLLGRHGSIWPAPDIYDDVIAENGWAWFYSTFIAGPEASIAALNPHIRVYFGPMKQGSVMDLRGDTFSMTGI